MSSLTRFSLNISLSCLLTILGCVTEPESDTINIHVRGTVTSEMNGSPIDSAQIILNEYYWPSPVIGGERLIMLETYTGAFGFFEIREEVPLLPDGNRLLLSAIKPGYQIHMLSVEWSSDIQIIQFPLSPLSPLR